MDDLIYHSTTIRTDLTEVAPDVWQVRLKDRTLLGTITLTRDDDESKQEADASIEDASGEWLDSVSGLYDAVDTLIEHLVEDGLPT